MPRRRRPGSWPAARAAGSARGRPSRPPRPTTDLFSVKGLRDGAHGLLGLALPAFVGARAEAWFMLAVAVVPLFDTLIVLRNGGAKAVAFGIHFATAVVVLISAGLLFAV
ncbi:DUF4267 domain-containing protein [Streptomyces sediminimaris]|uniref:DUF4267 domain-containing protein n=1 Tax=Streptomyces sediminimaris TaxID=3383721 RepID=UPI00399BC73B